MRIFCCYTDAHEVLLRDYFRPSLPADCALTATRLELTGAGDFLSPEWMTCLRRKVALVRKSLDDHPEEELLVWSDVDVIFLRPVAAELQALMAAGPGWDILFQRESPHRSGVNGGFYVCRANQRTRAFFHSVEATMDQLGCHDQDAFSIMLSRLPPDALRWGLLPTSYYARTHGWPPPLGDLALYHANETTGSGGIARKIAQFRELAFVRRWGWPAVAWSCVPKIFKRLSRVVAERGRGFRG